MTRENYREKLQTDVCKIVCTRYRYAPIADLFLFSGPLPNIGYRAPLRHIGNRSNVSGHLVVLGASMILLGFGGFWK